jgi:hypothetical protein
LKQAQAPDKAASQAGLSNEKAIPHRVIRLNHKLLVAGGVGATTENIKTAKVLARVCAGLSGFSSPVSGPTHRY